MYVENHVRRTETYDCVRMRVHVVEKLANPLKCLLCRAGLFRCYRAESLQYRHIYRSGVVQEAAHDLLYVRLLFIRNWGASLLFWYLLGLLAIYPWRWVIWTVLGPFWGLVSVAHKLFGNIVRHRGVDIPFFVIPIQSNAAVEFPFPVFVHFVKF